MDGPGDRADRRAVITRLDDSLAERFHRIPKFSVSVRSEAEVGAELANFLIQPWLHTGAIEGVRTRHHRKQFSESTCYFPASPRDAGLQCSFANAQSLDRFRD